ncbi:MAG TPA: YjbH domain-containing protein [Anaeromyxobacteraceae bacterium]|nr:YjbH domain-containing protein [Anaeromyxobacteraceae bacterium]
MCTRRSALARGLTLLAGAGVMQSSEAGGVGQLHWTEPGGRFALGVEGASTRDMYDSAIERTALTGSGQAWLPWLDVLAEVRAGRFLGGDRGATVRVSRFFGDTRVGFFYSDTDVRMAGFQLGLPLTPRREMRPGLVQLRGDNRFSQGIATVVGDERNPVRFGVATSPLTRFNLQEVFLDAGRLSRDRVLEDLPRMRATFRREIDAGWASRCDTIAR